MEANRTPKVKICCIQSVQEAQMAIQAGATWIGLVSEMPSGPGVIDEERITAIADRVRGRVLTVLLTSKQDAGAIIDQAGRTRTDALQLVDQLPGDHLQDLRRKLPGVFLIQVVHVQGAEALDQARRVRPHVDALLLDSGNPHREVKELGGTGRVHDWQVSGRIREELDVPVLLAGGLTPGNVRQAIELVGPAGVDVCSGVRREGLLDAPKLQEFMNNARHIS